MASAIEAVGSTSIELALGAGLPAMVVLRGLVSSDASACEGQRGVAPAKSCCAIPQSKALRDATRSSMRRGAAKAAFAPRAREVERLGGCSDIESVAEVGERHFARA